MRTVFMVVGVFALLLADMPVAIAQSADDDGDTADEVKLAQKLADSDAPDGDADPSDDDAQSAEPQLPALPAAQEQPAAPVQMMAGAKSLDHFGQQHFAAGPAPAPAAPVEEKAKEPTKKAQAAADATNAHVAAETAKNAADVANKVATQSVKLVGGAKSALKDAQDAIHHARVNTQGLSSKQKHSLKTAEGKLKEATKKADYGEVKNAKYVKADVEKKQLQKLDEKMDKLKKEKPKEKKPKGPSNDELEAMRKEIEDLRKELKKKEGDKEDDDALLKELQESIKEMEKADKKDDHATKKSHDEMKAEVERLRAEIHDMQDDEGKVTYSIPAKEEKPAKKVVAEKTEKAEEKVEKYNVKKNMKALSKDDEEVEEKEEVQENREVAPVEQKGLDIDTAMPYGDLEPFGREDTAQELTEASIRESDGMVDTIEKAEVAEEKRSVFRALTRLRGAAITSFDGVARSQSGNIDEFNKIHKWRNTHPIHHLADEESDVSKWAFPDNAD